MATSCSIYLRERGNESGNLFNIGPFCTVWSFKLLRRNGCGPATFTAVMTDAQWATLEATGLLTADTVVHFYFKMNEAAEHRTWSGTLKSFPLDKNTPPERRRRKFTCSPVWTQLKKPGCLVLRAFDDDETMQAIVQGLVDPSISDHTDVNSSTADITTGADFSPGRTLFIDQSAESCLKKCAQVYGDVVYGVSGSDDQLYFADETNSTADPVATFRQGVHADGAVKFTRTTMVRPQQMNHAVVEGREAKAGNPMSMEYEDPDLATTPSMIRRSKTYKAPENVKGTALLRWAEYLVNLNKGSKTVGVLAVAGIDTKFTEEGDVLRTWEQVNGNIAVEDEDGNPLGQWPIQRITYSGTNRGAYGANFQLGDELQQDIVDALGIRDTLREIEVYALKEFSNQVELQAMNDNWLEDAYVFFVLNHGMRNSVRVSLQSLRHIDFDHVLTTGIITDATDDGITGLINANDATVIGQFVTQQIPVGKHYDEWALLRNIEYPRLIEGEEGAGRRRFWMPAPLPPHDGQTWNPTWRPLFSEGLDGPLLGLNPRANAERILESNTDYYGVMLHDGTVHPSADIDWLCKWRNPRNHLQDSAYIIFGYTDLENYHFVEFTQSTLEGRLVRWRAGRYVDGMKTYSSVVFGGLTVGGTEDWHDHINFRIEPNVLLDTYTFKARPWNYVTEDWDNWASQSSELGWFTLNEATHAVGFGQRWDDMPQGAIGADKSPSWLRMTFDSTEAGDSWYISRDGGDSWEGPFDPDTGALVNLGAYAGPGEEKDYILIKGYVAYPQLTTGYAAGWK